MDGSFIINLILNDLGIKAPTFAKNIGVNYQRILDIPKETIAAGLGHSASSVTDIYITFDRRKVDEANRRIIDFVLKQ